MNNNSISFEDDNQSIVEETTNETETITESNDSSNSVKDEATQQDLPTSTEPIPAVIEDKKKSKKKKSEKPKKDEAPENSEKPVKQIKNVSVGQCIRTILFSIFAFCVALIPATFGNTGINITLNTLPIIGDGSISNAQLGSATGFAALLNMDSLLDTISSLLNLSVIAYFGILAANVLFSLFLAITRFQVLRVIFKIYSILAGFAMIFILLMSLVHLMGFFGLIIQGIIPIETVMTAIETSAILTAIGLAIFSGLLIGRQFKWFARLY